jgi:hypothetical protein
MHGRDSTLSFRFRPGCAWWRATPIVACPWIAQMRECRLSESASSWIGAEIAPSLGSVLIAAKLQPRSAEMLRMHEQSGSADIP